MRDFDRFRVRIAGLDLRIQTQLCRGDREYSGSGANVKKTAAFEILFNCPQAKPRRFMSAGAKCHARLDPDSQAIRGVYFAPRRRDDETGSYGNRLPTLFPFPNPVVIRDFAQSEYR